MMSELTFESLSEQILTAFGEERYADGLELAGKNLAAFPEKTAQLNYWRMILAARLEDPAGVNRIFEETLAAGIWFSERLMRRSPSLEGMNGNEEYERLIKVAAQMQAVDPTNRIPALVVRPEGACGAQDDACPLLYFLHGNTDSPAANLLHWRELANQGWVLAMPQSSKAMWPEAYFWPAYEECAAEIEHHYNNLAKQYSVDPEKTILAGFSMGAEIALATALSGKIPARGFILLGPGGYLMDDVKDWEPFIEQAAGRGLRGMILTGEEDDSIPHDNIRQLVELLNDRGISTQHKSYPNLKHEYPPDFSATLKDSIEFIFE